MNSLLYFIAIVLLIGWAIGVFAYSLSGFIHILLAIAAISILLRIIKGEKIFK
jgi:hypothetical protein